MGDLDDLSWNQQSVSEGFGRVERDWQDLKAMEDSEIVSSQKNEADLEHPNTSGGGELCALVFIILDVNSTF